MPRTHPLTTPHPTRRDVVVGAGLAAALVAVAPTPALALTPQHHGDVPMSTFTTRDGTEIFYKAWGTGQPVMFHHGWPLSSDDWDAQLLYFLQHGYRVIAPDRRGHGRSSQTATGNEGNQQSRQKTHDPVSVFAHL